MTATIKTLTQPMTVTRAYCDICTKELLFLKINTDPHLRPHTHICESGHIVHLTAHYPYYHKNQEIKEE